MSPAAAFRLLLALLQLVLAAAAPLADARLHRAAPASARLEADRRAAPAAAAECALCQFIRTPAAAGARPSPPGPQPARATDSPFLSIARRAAFEPGSPPARGPPRSSLRPLRA